MPSFTTKGRHSRRSYFPAPPTVTHTLSACCGAIPNSFQRINHLKMRFTAFFYLPLLLPTIMAKPRVLIYSLTREFRHESIPSAIKALQAKAIAINVEFDNSEDPARFTDEGLSRYDAIIFLSNTAEGARFRSSAPNVAFILCFPQSLMNQENWRFRTTSTTAVTSLAFIRLATV